MNKEEKTFKYEPYTESSLTNYNNSFIYKVEEKKIKVERRNEEIFVENGNNNNNEEIKAVKKNNSTILKEKNNEVVYGKEYKPYESTDVKSKKWIVECTENSSKYWDNFYKIQGTAYKTRYYLHKEYPQLLEERKQNILEMGCGVGSTIFPLQEKNPNLNFCSFDFSEECINILKSREEYENLMANNPLTKVFVWDPVTEDSPDFIPENYFDYCLLIFVLGSIAPHLHTKVFDVLKRHLKPGGSILFRDHAVGDIKNQIFSNRNEKSLISKKVSENYHIRRDGTQAIFLSTEHMENICKESNLVIDTNKYVNRQTTNVKLGTDTKREFIKGIYTKPLDDNEENNNNNNIK